MGGQQKRSIRGEIHRQNRGEELDEIDDSAGHDVIDGQMAGGVCDAKPLTIGAKDDVRAR